MINGNFWIPKDPNDPADWNAAERGMWFESGWFMNPIFGTGDYPDVMKEFIGRKSRAAGLNESRLPTFTEEEKTLVKGKRRTVRGCTTENLCDIYTQKL